MSDREEWSGLAMPGSGWYVVPRALAPVEINLDGDLGVYTEPNVWVRHDIS